MTTPVLGQLTLAPPLVGVLHQFLCLLTGLCDLSSIDTWVRCMSTYVFDVDEVAYVQLC